MSIPDIIESRRKYGEWTDNDLSELVAALGGTPGPATRFLPGMEPQREREAVAEDILRDALNPGKYLGRDSG